jgi:hypothetical protein
LEFPAQAFNSLKNLNNLLDPGLDQKEKPLQLRSELQGLQSGGADGTRTRDPRRDRPVF